MAEKMLPGKNMFFKHPGHYQGSWNSVSEQNKFKTKNKTINFSIYVSTPIICAQEDSLDFLNRFLLSSCM